MKNLFQRPTLEKVIREMQKDLRDPTAVEVFEQWSKTNAHLVNALAEQLGNPQGQISIFMILAECKYDSDIFTFTLTFSAAAARPEGVSIFDFETRKPYTLFLNYGQFDKGPDLKTLLKA